MAFLIVANWKMTGSSVLVHDFLLKLTSVFSESLNRHDFEVIICPPYTALGPYTASHERVRLGAQDCFPKTFKKCTGAISADMLKECSCDYVIVGHSERREILGEKDSDIKLKAESALECGITPIICIGESIEERNKGLTKDTLLRQYFSSCPEGKRFIVAYEPVWAIGGSFIPDIGLIEESLDIVRSCNNEVPLLYGGSVNGNNVRTLKQKINGLGGVLVGGASTNIDAFSEIILNLV